MQEATEAMESGTVSSKGGTSTLAQYGDDFGKMGT